MFRLSKSSMSPSSSKYIEYIDNYYILLVVVYLLSEGIFLMHLKLERMLTLAEESGSLALLLLAPMENRSTVLLIPADLVIRP